MYETFRKNKFFIDFSQTVNTAAKIVATTFRVDEM